MKQKPWDRYEAALLLSYCLKIEAGDIPRKEAVDMIRVDVDEFVSEDQIHFDTNAVDTLLKSMVGTRFAPIRSVNTFALFPSCGASWQLFP